VKKLSAHHAEVSCIIAVEEEFLDTLMFKKSEVQRYIIMFTKAVSGRQCYFAYHKTYTRIICLCTFSLVILEVCHPRCVCVRTVKGM